MATGLLDAGSSNVVYDIRHDSRLLSQMREASLSSGPWGLTVANGIVGSPEWWDAVNAGQVQIEVIDGVIQDGGNGPMGDTPEVRIAGAVTSKSWLPWAGFHPGLFGQRVRIIYAIVPPKNPPEPEYVVDLILQIQVAD